MMMPPNPNSMGPPPGAMTLGAKKKKTSTLPNIVDDDNGKKKMKFIINKFYHIFYVVRNGAKSFGWFLSCMSFMYLLPMGVEYMNEQNKIMAKISASMGDSAGGGMMPPM